MLRRWARTDAPMRATVEIGNVTLAIYLRTSGPSVLFNLPRLRFGFRRGTPLRGAADRAA
jgi:hypothetical protein